MSSLTNDQHKDDLALRRRRKRAQSAARDDGPTPAAHSSQAARGLIGGLITGAPDSDKHAADPDAPPSSENPPVTLPGQVAPQRPTNSASTPAADQENIDQLIRRVREGIVADGEALTDVSERRPQGTADLTADPAPVPRRRVWRLPTKRELSRPQTELKHVARYLAAAAAVVMGTIALLAITLTSDPHHAARTRRHFAVKSPTSQHGRGPAGREEAAERGRDHVQASLDREAKDVTRAAYRVCRTVATRPDPTSDTPS